MQGRVEEGVEAIRGEGEEGALRTWAEAGEGVPKVAAVVIQEVEGVALVLRVGEVEVEVMYQAQVKVQVLVLGRAHQSRPT